LLTFAHQIDELEKLLDAPLHVLYMKQLQLCREKAVKSFQKQLATAKDGTEYDAMSQADEMFRREAEECTRRQSSDWSFGKEASLLKSSLSEIVFQIRKNTQIQLKGAKQNQQAMQYLQFQNQQLQALQQQMMVSSIFCIDKFTVFPFLLFFSFLFFMIFLHFILFLGCFFSLASDGGISDSRHKFQFPTELSTGKD
jgi:hypothetical protein